MNYWGYRIDKENRGYFLKEILEGRLRQGWGYSDSQNLKGEKVDESARRNFPIFNKVKAGDILLVPHIESWDDIVIVEATQDFDTGYEFRIDDAIGDYGHIFPVKLIKIFSRHNFNVDGDIRETMKCRSRFWNINRCEDSIKKILRTEEGELKTSSSYIERFRRCTEESFHEDYFANDIYAKLNKVTQASEWEYILCEGFRKICPKSYSILPTGNGEEKKHGADIIIGIPGIMDQTYVIAIQVKDYSDEVDKKPIDQICKADEYFKDKEGYKLIDKYLFIIRAEKEINETLLLDAKARGVKIFFDKDIKRLLSKMAKGFILEGVNE